MKKILVFIIFLFIVGIGIYWQQFYKPRIKTFSNITFLYSLFTEYMKHNVEYRLSLIDCEPKEYYYEDSSVCFVCDKMDACFGYTWVNRSSGNRMNLKDLPYLKNYKKIDVKVADFYNDRLASFFNCKEKDEKTLECDYTVTFVLGEKSVIMTLKNPEELENIARKICESLKKPSLQCSESGCRCDNTVVGLFDRELIIYKVL